MLIHVRPEDVQKNYEQLYAAVGRAVSAHVGHPYDDKCKILTQPCFYSWHPEAYYNPGAIAFEMPAESVTKVTEAETKETIAPGNAPSENGFIANFLDEFEHRNPFIRGSRNDLALKLGREQQVKDFRRRKQKSSPNFSRSITPLPILRCKIYKNV